MKIAIDFDGTITERNEYPACGSLRRGAAKVINLLYADGHTIIIWTCRKGAELADAVGYMAMHGIPYHYINENPPEMIAAHDGDTRKIVADVYVDDKQVGGLPAWDEIYNLIMLKVWNNDSGI